jgi:hypothetical protein
MGVTRSWSKPPGRCSPKALRKSECCWYLPAADEAGAVRAAINKRRVDTTRAIPRGALRILSSDAVYAVRGDFDPEETRNVFSGSIRGSVV